MERKGFLKLIVRSWAIISAGLVLARVTSYGVVWFSSGFERFPVFSDFWADILFSLGMGVLLTAIIFLFLYFKFKRK